jgi:hypothetical protein
MKCPLYNIWLSIVSLSPACSYVITLVSKHILQRSILQNSSNVTQKQDSKWHLNGGKEKKLFCTEWKQAKSEYLNCARLLMGSLRATPLLLYMLQSCTGTNWRLYVHVVYSVHEIRTCTYFFLRLFIYQTLYYRQMKRRRFALLLYLSVQWNQRDALFIQSIKN